MNKILQKTFFAAALVLVAQGAQAACTDIAGGWNQLNNAAFYALARNTGGYGLNMWLTMVDETGTVCYVVETSNDSGTAVGGPTGHSGSEWLGSRVISAQKANTANAFSLDGYAISTANLYSPVQPGGSLFGLQASNPIDASRVYAGAASTYGTVKDPLAFGKLRTGGVNVFGGGLALYKGGKKIGAIGASGDTSCKDHAFAWQVRKYLQMEPAGVGITTANVDATNAALPVPKNHSASMKGDEMLIGPDNATTTDLAWVGWSHPLCPNTETNITAGYDIGVIPLQ